MPKKEIKLSYLTTKRPTNPDNYLDFPVDWREPIEKPLVFYRDEKGKTYVVERAFPHPPNKAFYELLLSPRYVFSKIRKITKKEEIKIEDEKKEFGARMDLPLEIDGTIVKRRGKIILVLSEDNKWIYNFRREDLNLS